jgi:lycopene beta-cyclase
MTTRVVLVGGGLANGLIAWRLHSLPAVELTVVEREATLGGNHTWSFHDTDVTDAQLAWLAPFVAARWAGHDVEFPERRRQLDGGYLSITAERFHATLAAALGGRMRLGTGVRSLSGNRVELDDGRVLAADLVLDGRGPGPVPSLEVRYQKFLGHFLELEQAHGRTRPLLMDGTVPQRDGYRFVYTLPFAPKVVLVEDTYYSDTPDLDIPALRREVTAYAAAQGFAVTRVLREETGVLPIVLAGDPERIWPRAEAGLPRTGIRAGLFHHTTGYSLPEAAALADDLAALATGPGGLGGSDRIGPWIRRRFLRRWRQQGFYRMLNRLLFVAARPDERYRIMQHFYRLPEPTIARFYAGRSNVGDMLRILTGKPPIPIPRALWSLLKPLPRVTSRVPKERA